MNRTAQSGGRDGGNMDFRTQRYFVTVAEELNFTRAAEKLQMSQPPLSNTIRELEEDLGVQLFIRGKRHLQLTEAGRVLLQRSRQMLELAEKTREELRTYGEELSGRLFIATVDGRAPHLAARWITGFREEYPGVTFDLTNGSSDEVIERLLRGLADLAIIAAPYDSEHLLGIPVGREPWAAIIPKDHPLARLEGSTVTLRQLSGQNLIIPQRKSRIDAIEHWFAENGAELTAICTLSNYEDAVAMAEHGAGISIFPMTTRHTSPEVVSKIITEPAKYVEYVLVSPKFRKLAGAAEAFVDFVRDDIEERQRLTGGSGQDDPFFIPEGADIL